MRDNALRELIWAIGAKPAIPSKRNEATVACRPWIYQNRNMVERLWARLKEWRAVATRYEKTARSFLGVLCLAATFDWIKGKKGLTRASCPSTKLLSVWTKNTLSG